MKGNISPKKLWWCIIAIFAFFISCAVSLTYIGALSGDFGMLTAGIAIFGSSFLTLTVIILVTLLSFKKLKHEKENNT
jgi:hypothetical protein